jgi:hypothetical protein
MKQEVAQQTIVMKRNVEKKKKKMKKRRKTSVRLELLIYRGILDVAVAS